MNKQYDVVALGELLIDFTENGTSGQGNPVYEANPGGAPCNVLSMLNRLGHQTAFLGKVGNDIFGRQLRSTVESAGINVEGLLTDEDDYVQVIIDKEVAEAEWFGCNPGINTSHLKFKTKDLLQKYLPAIHHRARIVDL